MTMHIALYFALFLAFAIYFSFNEYKYVVIYLLMTLIGSVRNIKISCDFKSSIIINLKASDYEF